MKKFISLLFILTIFVGFNKAQASHAAGGEITYKLVPNTTNTYTITFKLYRDCDGINPGNTQTLCYNNSCFAPTVSTTMNLIPGTGLGNILTSSCPGFPTTCTDPSGLPGYEGWYYTTNVTLPTQCNSWKFWVSIGARNAVDWLAGGNLYIEATFDNTISQNDDSPIFSANPNAFACIGQQANVALGCTDANGDSLVYEAIQPRTASSSCNSAVPSNLAYTGFPVGQTGNAVINPVPTGNTYVLNTTNGNSTFLPTTVGDGVVTVRVKSYRNGQLIGTIMRDIIVNVLANCPLFPQPPGIDSNTVVGLYIDSTQVNVCLGDSISFCGYITSTDTGAVIVARDNSGIAVPGAVTTYQGIGTDSVLFCFTWQTTLLDTGLHVVTVTYADSSCKPPGILIPQNNSFTIFVDYATEAFGDTILCAGDSTQLSAVGGGPYTWNVLPGGSPITSLSCINCDNPWVKPTLPTFYTVTGCTVDTVFIDVATIPTLNITPDTTTCVNASLQLQVVAGPPGQTYSVTWAPGNFLNSTTIPNPVVTNPTASTIYTVTVIPQTLAACAATETVNVTVLNGFSINPYDTILCDGETTAITGTGSTSYSYNWTPPADVSPVTSLNTTISPNVPGGTYTITASFPGCPDSTLVIPVIMDPNPVVDAGVDREMCLNDTIHLQASAMPDTIAYTINWVPSADLNSSSISNPVFDGAQTTLLTVTYTTPNGCFGTDDVTVIVNSVDFIALDGDRTLCPGDTATLSALGAVSYFWYPNYYINTVGNVPNVVVYPDVNTDYWVVGVDVNGCLDTAKATVKIAQQSVMDAGDDVTIYPGESAQLNAAGNCSIFSWFPPSGLSSTTVMNPVAQPTVTTKYVVNGQTENGCPTVDSITVRVSTETLLDLPNAFTPGSGTSINDMLKIKKRGIATLRSWKMYNRWGEEVFSTKDIEAGWDGQFKGKPQPMGAYVFVLEAETSTGKVFTKQGTVTLIR